MEKRLWDVIEAFLFLLVGLIISCKAIFRKMLDKEDDT